MRTLIGAATVALLTSTPAFAQEAFDGFYAGVAIGYDFQPSDSDESVTFDRGINGSFGETVTTSAGANAFSPGFCGGAATSPQNSACRSDSDGGDYHVRLGYDRQMGKLVLGAVAEFGTADVRDSVSAFSTTPAFYTLTRKVDYDAALRLRAGYTVAPQTLVYATGGVAYAKLDHSFTTSNTANAFAVIGDDGVWGYQAGAGIEQKLGARFSIGAEYLYSRYSDDDARVRVSQGAAGATNPFVLAGGVDFKRNSNQFDYHAVRAVAAYRF